MINQITQMSTASKANTHNSKNNNVAITTLDKTDRHILELLVKDARMSISDIAKAINLSDTPCTRRVKRLESLGVITGYHASTDREKLGYNLSIYVSISMDKHTSDRFDDFEEKIQEFDEVVSCSVITGRTEDYLLKVVVRDIKHYEEFLLERLNKVEGVAQVHTSVELREVFSRSIY